MGGPNLVPLLMGIGGTAAVLAGIALVARIWRARRSGR